MSAIMARERKQRDLLDVAQQAEAAEAAVDAASEQLLKQCSEVIVTTSWYPTSVKVSGEKAEKMLKAVNAKKRGVSMSKKLFTSRHPAVKACNEAKTVLNSYIHSMTVPMLALKTVESVDDNAANLKKDAGVRLIQKKDMEAFEERLTYLRGVLESAVEDLQSKLEDVKAWDKEDLEDLYDESDYPEDVRELVNVVWRYRSTAIDLDWQEICPAIFDRVLNEERVKMRAVVENASIEFADNFVSYIRQVTNQLGNRIRLAPPSGHKLHHLMDAEVVTKLTHELSPGEVEHGQVLLEVRYTPPRSTKSVTVWLEPMTLKEYDDLQPYETDEKKKLYSSSLQNLKDEIETFVNIGAMLGPYRNIIEGSVRQVQELLTKASRDMNTDKIATELRSSTTFRDSMRETLAAVAARVEDAIVVEQTGRRRINMGMLQAE